MRIIAGRFRGRKLVSPEGQGTRPTTDRTRGALFNILRHSFEFEGAVVADIFAGTGALGLEALSNGAKSATFVENGRAALTALQQNINGLGVAESCKIVRQDARRLPPHAGQPCHVVFLDPPYEKGYLPQVLEGLSQNNWLADDSLCVCEQSAAEPDLDVDGFVSQDIRVYGSTKFSFLKYQRNR